MDLQIENGKQFALAKLSHELVLFMLGYFLTRGRVTYGFFHEVRAFRSRRAPRATDGNAVCGKRNSSFEIFTTNTILIKERTLVFNSFDH